MSLGKLLATGRSLVGGAPNEGRYNISSRNRLPKFGAEKNPFAPSAPSAQVTPVPTQSELGQSEAAPDAIPEPAPPTAAATQVEEYTKTRRIPELADQKPARGMQRVIKSGKRLFHAVTAFSLATFVKLLGFIGRLPGRFRRPEQKSVIPRFGKPAVQTELSLDNVKVVRNDLEESDLEIVTADTATSTQVAPTVPPAAPNRGPVPRALKKLTDRVLGPKSS